jgi:hypothetical protein
MATRTSSDAASTRSAGIASIAASTVHHAAWRTAPRFTRSAVSSSATATPTTRMREDESRRTRVTRAIQSMVLAPYFALRIFFASRCTSAALTTRSSTIPARNCSADPAQKRSMIARTARAATLRGAIAAR